jgi:hypothetical protein
MDAVQKKPRYRVYVIKLKKTVLGSQRFRRENPGYQKNKPCVYVGYTSKTPEERLKVHRTDRLKGSSWVRRYGKKLFLWAYKELPPFESGEEAKEAESLHAKKLRSRGWGAWQK